MNNNSYKDILDERSMVWYNPLSWFRQDVGQEEIELYCDNPQCRQVLNRKILTYNEEIREVYHDFGCAQIATAHKVFQSGRMAFANIEPLELEEAKRLFREGNLKQSKGLEKAVSPLN